MTDQSNGTESQTTAHVVVSVEDRLLVENLHLKILNITHQVSDLQRAVLAKSQELQDVQNSILGLKDVLEKKYNINLTTHHIVPDSGVVIPAPTNSQFGELVRNAGRV